VLITHNAGIAALGDRVVSFADGKIAGIESNETRVNPSEVVW